MSGESLYIPKITYEPSVHWRIVLTVKERIIDHALCDVKKENVEIRKLPWLRQEDISDLELPRILVSFSGIEEVDPEAGTTARDDIVYPVVVSMIRSSNEDLFCGMPTLLSWRQEIRRLFHNRSMCEVPEVWKTTAEPGAILSPEAFREQLDHSAWIIQATAREFRTS